LDIDPARRDISAGCIDLSFTSSIDLPDLYEAPVFDRYIGTYPGIAVSVQHPAVSNDQVVVRGRRL